MSATNESTPFDHPTDLALILLVIGLWGVNFAVIKVGVAEIPPFLLGALRFTLAAFPALLFFRRPKVPLRLYLLYGMTISVGQFAFLFTAIRVGMPSGLASLILQSQSFFTLFLGRYPANRIALFSMLVPLVGLTTGWLVFDEALQPIHFAGGALLMLGLLVNAFGARWRRG